MTPTPPNGCSDAGWGSLAWPAGVPLGRRPARWAGLQAGSLQSLLEPARMLALPFPLRPLFHAPAQQRTQRCDLRPILDRTSWFSRRRPRWCGGVFVLRVGLTLSVAILAKNKKVDHLCWGSGEGGNQFPLPAPRLGVGLEWVRVRRHTNSKPESRTLILDKVPLAKYWYRGPVLCYPAMTYYISFKHRHVHY